jgi:predicted TIM-barrel fold metal-dependent hydrolase
LIQLNDRETASVLERIRELALIEPIFDMHVHASEIFSGRNVYSDPGASGVYSVSGKNYQAPHTGKLTLDTGDRRQAVSAAAKARVSEMMFNRVYEHIGPAVLLDHMNICGLSDALLLPVVGRAEEIDVQMARLMEHSASTNRLHIAYCVPNSVRLPDIAAHIGQVAREFPIEAVKIHPNVSRIDLRQSDGRERIEAILHSCGELDLPVIIHGGRSPMLTEEAAGEFAVLDNLAKIDWGVTRSTVVISHFGSYGFDQAELSQEREKLAVMLERHPNVMTDTSGLPYHTLMEMLPVIDIERILFGSDSLYVLMWQSVVTLMCALKDSVGERADEYFCRITSGNVRSVFGGAS